MLLIMCLLSVVVLLINYNKTVRYYFKCAAITVGLTTITTGLFPFIILRGRTTRNTRTYSRLISPFIRLMGIKFEVRNRKILEEDTNMVVVANHQNFLDTMLIFHLGKIPLSPVAKKEIMYYYIYGIVMWLCDCIMIDRKKPASAIEQINSAVQRKIEKKETIKVFIYPEGTRCNNQQIQEFKKGAFYLAIEKKLPIVPLVYSTYKPFINHKQKQLDRMRIIVTVLPKIPTDNLTLKDVNDLILKTRTAMENAYKASNKEIEDYLKASKLS